MIPWITPADMSTHSGKTIRGGSRSLTETGLSESGAKWLPEGTVLFSSRAPIGYTAIALRAITTNQGFKSFIPEPCVSSDYLYHWLTSSKERAEKLASGTTFLELSGAKAALLPVPLAPFAEQKRIVEKLEELLSELDAGVAELKAAQRKLAQYRQSLLKAAVEGSLTADWRAAQARLGKPQETGAELLQRILTERRARWEAKQLAKFDEQCKTPPKGWASRYLAPSTAHLDELPKLPEGWAWATLDQLTEFVTSGSRGWANYYANRGATFIRSQNIKNDWLDLSDIAFANPPPDSEGSRTLIKRGDLLLTITGANVGKCACVNSDLDKAYVSQHVALIRPVDSNLSAYLHWYLICNAGGRGQLDKQAYGAGKPGLNLEQITSVVVPIPNSNELPKLMGAIASGLETMTAQAIAIERALKQIAVQRKNILKAAFSGKLVPQDPSDEPASKLLERIRADRAARGDIGRKRSRKAKEAV